MLALLFLLASVSAGKDPFCASTAGPRIDSTRAVADDSVTVTGFIRTTESSPYGFWFELTLNDSASLPDHLTKLFLLIRSDVEARFPVNPRCYFAAGNVTARGVIRNTPGGPQMDISWPYQISTPATDIQLHLGPTIQWEEAFKYVGQIKLVEGVVEYASNSAGGCEMVLAQRSGCKVSVYLKSIDIGYFRGLGRNPEDYYPGKKIRATGLVEYHLGQLQMVVSNNCMIRELPQ